MKDGHRIDKRWVSDSFSKAATTYDQVAHLQRAIGEQLLSGFPWKDELGSKGGVALDVGCGTGFFTRQLETLSGSPVIGIDLAYGMVSYARKQHPDHDFVVGDMDYLPLRQGSCQVIFSSLAVQWSENLEKVLADCYQALAPGGTLLFSTLLEGTLEELASSWKAADSYRHVNQFMTLTSLQGIISGSMFGDQLVKTEDVVLQYQEVRELTNELKKLGAHNVNRDRPQSMTGKAAIRKFKSAYESFRRNGQLPATYCVAYVYLKKS